MKKSVKILLAVFVGVPLVLIIIGMIVFAVNGDKWEAERRVKDSLAVIEQLKIDSTNKAVEVEKERAFNALPKAEREKILAQKVQDSIEAELAYQRLHAENEREEMKKVFEDRTSLRVMQNKAEAYIEEHLKDPSSYKSINVSDVKMTSDGFLVLVQYSATNSFNARIQDLKTVKFDKTGRTVVSIE